MINVTFSTGIFEIPVEIDRLFVSLNDFLILSSSVLKTLYRLGARRGLLVGDGQNCTIDAAKSAAAEAAALFEEH